MRIAVFGANGPTGRHLTEQALASGHEVVAVTRRAGSLPARPGLAVAVADGVFTARADLAASMCASWRSGGTSLRRWASSPRP